MIFLYLLACLVSSTLSQRVESVQNPNAENGCNVVNVHFGRGDDEGDDVNARGYPGPPGKRGVIGPTGMKGNKGETGAKGNTGPIPDLHTFQASVLQALSARSCADLRVNYGISTTGYYLMRGDRAKNQEPSYRYCDFKVYQGVSTCAELVDKYNISRYGYYQLGSSNAGFHYCPDVYTCHQLAERDGVDESGLYQLGSPGEYFRVFCTFFSGQAITEVWHDSMDEIQATRGCTGAACYQRVPQYNVDDSNILKIIRHSKSCRQFIKYRCQGTLLLNGGSSSMHGYWISRDGEKMKYWGDALSKTAGYCACGETGSCINKSKKCNCDSNSGSIKTQDEGYLYDRLKLPVKEMRFGDLDGSHEYGWHTLGKLECSGQAD